ncbi:YCF48-related protein [Chitinophaga sp. YIM B06452]|uniref:WD40/YVTN/BNR-like repeat-containing protein n=1 Tax=Chitinophaga sp. YIM B06452 TaxID=3082158 RepID=UPI0031FEE5FE
MKAVRIVCLIIIPLLVVLSSCGRQTGSDTKNGSSLGSIPSSGISYPLETADGIIYFSADNGLTWENKSTGLPATTRIGLGGIAVSENRLALLSKDSGLYFFNNQEDRWINIPTDRQLIESNPGALQFYKDRIYAGTQFGGIFYSENEGKSWTKLNTGLDNFTIRKFAEIDHKLYAATNSGFYSYNDLRNQWEQEYGNSTLQVNGIAVFDRSIYIATNQGAFSSPIGKKDWKKIFSNGALHNISSDDKGLYAMVYNELFSSFDKGNSWQNIQKGLPAQLYTFNVIRSGNALLAGQWDGVYRKDKESENWKFSSAGLPNGLAIANMISYKGAIVVSGSERKLRAGMDTDKN